MNSDYVIYFGMHLQALGKETIAIMCSKLIYIFFACPRLYWAMSAFYFIFFTRVRSDFNLVKQKNASPLIDY